MHKNSNNGLEKDLDVNVETGTQCDFRLVVIVDFVVRKSLKEYRSMLHKLDERSLDLYELLYSPWFRGLNYISLIVLFVLPFFEWPSSLTKSSDIRIEVKRPLLPCGITEFVELLCLIILTIDSVYLARAFGKSWVLTNPWLIGRYVLLIVSFLDLFVSLCYRCTEFYRIRRFFRPYFLLSNSQLMKKVIKCFNRTLPKLLSTLFIMLLWLTCATLVALCIFSKPVLKPNKPANETATNSTSLLFVDFYTTMFNLLVLVTTANHPDVFIPSYNANRATAIFTIIYLSVGLYVFMNILTACVYSECSGYLLSSVQKRLTRRRTATRAAFEVLKYTRNGLDLVSNTDILSLIDSVRLSSWKKEALFKEYVSKFGETDLDSKQFMQLFTVLDLCGPSQHEISRPVFTSSFARHFQAWVLSTYFEKLSVAVSILNVIHLSMDISFALADGQYHRFEMWIVGWCFVAFYVAEQISLAWAHGYRVFYSKFPNIIGSLIVILLLIVKVIEVGFVLSELSGHRIQLLNVTVWDIVRLANILLVFRAVRLVNLFTWSRLVAGVLLDIPRNISPVLGILISIYYVYALLGMILFRNVIQYPSDANVTNFQCGTYQQLEYWSINFNDFAASLIVLWDLMVVNNWFVIVNAFQEALSTWVHIYMISWWIIVVVGMLSFLTAFIFESFVHRRELYMQACAAAKRFHEIVTVTSHLNHESTPLTAATGQPAGPAITTPRMACGRQLVSSQSDPNVSVNLATSPTNLIRVDPYTSLEVYSPDEINQSSMDEIFRSNLQEPSEESLLASINKHPYFACSTMPVTSSPNEPSRGHINLNYVEFDD